MKEKNICNRITAADKIFVYHRQTQERINMLWNAGQFSLLFWKIYSWLSKQIALTGSCRFTTTESQYYSLCYTAPLYRKIFIPLNLYIRQILSYLKQNESYLFETIFGLLPLSISLNRRSVVQKCQLSLSVLPWTLLALNGLIFILGTWIFQVKGTRVFYFLRKQHMFCMFVLCIHSLWLL